MKLIERRSVLNQLENDVSELKRKLKNTSGASSGVIPEVPFGYNYLRLWGADGSGDGQFHHAMTLALNQSGQVYVVDTYNYRVQRFAYDGTFIDKWGSFGSGAGQFRGPLSIVVGHGQTGNGDVYVTDYLTKTVQQFTEDGTFVTSWGGIGTSNGFFANGSTGPMGMAVDSVGNIYVSDSDGYRVQKFTSSGVYVTKWGTQGIGNGQFNKPYGIAIDVSDNVYVCDSGNHRIQKFTSTGVYLSQFGTHGSGNGNLHYPYGVALDSAGNIYVADSANYRIQKFTSAGDYITMWGEAGVGVGQLAWVYALAVNAAGDVYVAEADNDRVQVFEYSQAVGRVLTLVTDGTAWVAPADTEVDAIQVSATDKLVGRATTGAGACEEISCTAAGRALLDDTAASDQRTTLGLGTAAIENVEAFTRAVGTPYNITGRTTSIGTTILLASAPNGMYRVTVYAFSEVEGGGSLQVLVDGAYIPFWLANTGVWTPTLDMDGSAIGGGAWEFYVGDNRNISFYTILGGSDAHTLRVRLEYLGA